MVRLLLAVSRRAARDYDAVFEPSNCATSISDTDRYSRITRRVRRSGWGGALHDVVRKEHREGLASEGACLADKIQFT